MQQRQNGDVFGQMTLKKYMPIVSPCLVESLRTTRFLSTSALCVILFFLFSSFCWICLGCIFLLELCFGKNRKIGKGNMNLVRTHEEMNSST